MLRQKNNVSFLLALLVLLNLMMPLSVMGKELEGAVYASSGSFFTDDLGEDTGCVQVVYFLSGGIQNRYNRMSYPAFSGNYTLYKPYRYGYRFQGWYTDRARHNRINQITTDQTSVYLLYAKWTPLIDNQYNVEHYEYQLKDSGTDGKSIQLKNVEYDFWEQIDIPGMPQTKSEDFFKQYIFSESQCPQGICLTDEFVMITSYSPEDACMGELMIFDRESGEYRVTLGMDENSHLGGIAFDGENVWVCNSHEQTIERISFDFIQLMAHQNSGEVVDARDVVDEYKVKNTPSCITYYGERLWVATHTRMVDSSMVAYHFDSSTEKLTSLSEYKIPSKVQGVAFDESGRVYLSSSYGRSKSSYLLCYTSVTSLATRPNHPALRVEMPPCSEEIDISDDTVYILFESAGEKYLEGTDGKGTSLSPLDKILMIPVKELS